MVANKPMTDAELDRARHMIEAEGMSCKAVAQALGRSAHAIYNHFPHRWTTAQRVEAANLARKVARL